MSKIIIHNRSEITPDAVAVRIVSEIVAQGRVSGDQYCFLTSYNVDGAEVHFVSDKNAMSDKFIVYDVPHHNQKMQATGNDTCA